jgi:osmotically-inducible protein OsmY
MKIRAARLISMLILSTTVIAMMVVGCNKPQDVTAKSKSNSTLKAEVNDDEVTRRVKVVLANDENSSGFDIAVATLKGDLRLTGLVDNQSQIDYVIKLARSIDGVHSIHDELSIKK